MRVDSGYASEITWFYENEFTQLEWTSAVWSGRSSK